MFVSACLCATAVYTTDCNPGSSRLFLDSHSASRSCHILICLCHTNTHVSCFTLWQQKETQQCTSQLLVHNFWLISRVFPPFCHPWQKSEEIAAAKHGKTKKKGFKTQGWITTQSQHTTITNWTKQLEPTFKWRRLIDIWVHTFWFKDSILSHNPLQRKERRYFQVPP